ncbi:MAG: SCO family protein [Bacteroidota bacterium]
MVLSALKVVCQKGIIRVLALFLAIILIATSCQNSKEVLPFYNSPDFTAEWIKPSDKNYHSIHSIDTFSLQNQMGHIITKDSLNGNIYVANFFFTSCGSICPKMTNNLIVLQEGFKNTPQVKLVSFTVMPEKDSVAALKKYGSDHHINPDKWFLLTGNKERIYKLGRQSYFSEKRLGMQKDSSDFLHTESMLLIDKAGRIRGIYNATLNQDVVRAKADINLLLKE